MGHGAKALAAAAALLTLAWASAASAAWMQAETDRFIVYGGGGEKAVRDYALKLQTFDAMLRVLNPRAASAASATKLKVYLVRRRSDLREVYPAIKRDTVGAYLASNEGVFAVVVTDGGMAADAVLFHEYTHHFMLENFPVAYPAWFVEGMAEYFMTAEVLPDGVKVGGFHEARVYSLFQQSWLPMEDLLTKPVAGMTPDQSASFYALAWLLTHYMSTDAARAAQLDQAITAIAAGKEPLKAFEDATGMTPRQLTEALRAYRKLPLMRIHPPQATSPINVTTLPPSAGDLLLDELHLILAPTGKPDPDRLADIRRKAARHAGDALAERTLARAEFSLGDVAAGEAIVERQLAARPDDAGALLLAGTGQVIAGLRTPDEREARFRAARAPLAKAFAQDGSDFRPLYAYALSRTVEPAFPTDNDLNVLLKARQLAPSVQELSLRAGMALLRHNRREEAILMLAPVMNNPHGGGMAASARALIEGRSAAEAEAAGEAADADAAPD